MVFITDDAEGQGLDDMPGDMPAALLQRGIQLAWPRETTSAGPVFAGA